MGDFVYHTPLLTSRLLSERTGFDVRLLTVTIATGHGGSGRSIGSSRMFPLLKRKTDAGIAAMNRARSVKLFRR